jgi:Domain of unknown function (DUF6457)
MTDERSTTEILVDWNDQLSSALGIPTAEIDPILDLAGVVAHAIVRPAAPLTAFLVGYAAGVSAHDDGSGGGVDEAIAIARALATDVAP